MRQLKRGRFVLYVALFGACTFARADDVYSIKTIGMELARDIASETVLACRKKGYAVSAVVVDRDAILKAALRDDLASRFTLQIAEDKANMAVMAGRTLSSRICLCGASRMWCS